MLPLFDEATEEERIVLDRLYRVESWPMDWTKDLPFIRNLRHDFPHVDLAKESGEWADWMSEHEQKKAVKHRARFRQWCGKAERWAAERSPRVAGRHRLPEAEGHGEAGPASRW